MYIDIKLLQKTLLKIADLEYDMKEDFKIPINDPVIKKNLSGYQGGHKLTDFLSSVEKKLPDIIGEFIHGLRQTHQTRNL